MAGPLSDWGVQCWYSEVDSVHHSGLLNHFIYVRHHRVGRVLSIFSSRRNWDAPNPSPAGECVPPPGSGGRGTHTRWRERGGGRVPIPTRGHTLWYSLYITVRTLCKACSRIPKSIGVWILKHILFQDIILYYSIMVYRQLTFIYFIILFFRELCLKWTAAQDYVLFIFLHNLLCISGILFGKNITIFCSNLV